MPRKNGADRYEIAIDLITTTGILGVNLEEVPKSNDPNSKLPKLTYMDAFEASIERGNLISSGTETETNSETYLRIRETLSSGLYYRIVIIVKSYEDGDTNGNGDEEVTFTLKIEIGPLTK